MHWTCLCSSNFVEWLSQNWLVTCSGLCASQLSCTAHKLYFMHCTQAISYTLYTSYILCTAHKLYFMHCTQAISYTLYTSYNNYFMHCTQAMYISCTAHKLYLMHCTWSTLCVLHDSKKHASNTSCTVHESVFLCAAHKLTAILCQGRIKVYNVIAH